MFYFSWIDLQEEFSEEKHLQNTIPIVDLRLEEKEGSPAILDITLASSTVPFLRSGVLSCRQDGHILVLFKGVCHTIKSYKNGLYHVSFSLSKLSQDDFFQQSIEKLRPLLTTAPFYHPLLQSDESKDLLKSQAVVMYWDRRDACPRLSSCCPIKDPINITSFCDAESLRFDLHPPITDVTFSIQADWIQSLYGMFSVHQKIHDFFESPRKFYPQVIATYTGKNFEKSWPTVGPLGSSGYTVLHSSLEKLP